MKKIIKKSIGWLVYLAVLAGLVWGTPKILTYALKTPYPMASITSGSMWPVLKVGDMVLIKGVASKNDISVGDIIVYKNLPSTGSGQAFSFTIHRVIEKNANTVITKGDANNISDAPVTYDEVIGKTVNFNNGPVRIPYLGQISILINSRNAAAKN